MRPRRLFFLKYLFVCVCLRVTLVNYSQGNHCPLKYTTPTMTSVVIKTHCFNLGKELDGRGQLG